MAYWVDNSRSGNEGDINLVQIWVAPIPQSPPGSLTIDVVNDAPAYVVADLDNTTELPVAQDYTESIILPLARMLVPRSSQFSRPDLLPQLTVDYQVAMQRLAMAGGFPNVNQPEPKREVTA